MLKMVLGVIAVAVALATGGAATAQTMFRPVAVVNDSAITGYDLAQRAQIMVAMGFTAASTDALRAAALDELIEDRLKMQEGKRAGLNPSAELVAAGVAEMAQATGLPEDEFRAMMSAKGVSEQALTDLVTANLMWRELVRNRFARRIEPGAAEIDGEIALIGQKAGVSYRLGEIGLPLTGDGRSEAETRALAERLVAQLNQGASFEQAVKTHSRAPSAARGGEVGWVSSEQLPPDIGGALAALQPGEVSRPLAVSGGLSILKLLERRNDVAATVDTSNPELRDRVRQRLVNQQTARLAEGLLQELRRDALIELR